jgi:hypothetical protein
VPPAATPEIATAIDGGAAVSAYTHALMNTYPRDGTGSPEILNPTLPSPEVNETRSAVVEPFGLGIGVAMLRVTVSPVP